MPRKPQSAKRAPTAAQAAKHASQLKFTEATRTKILNALRAACTIDTACKFANVTRETLHQWMRKGATAAVGTDWRTFHDAVHEVLAAVEVGHAGNVSRAASGTPAVVKDGVVVQKAVPPDWRASYTILQARFGANWRYQQQVVTDGTQGAQAAAVGPSFDDAYEELQRVVARSASKAGK